MKINRDEHLPDVKSQISARALLRTVSKGVGVGGSIAEYTSGLIPGFKGYLESLKLAKNDYKINYTQILIEDLCKREFMTPEKAEELGRVLDQDQSVRLFLGYAYEAAEKSYSKRSKSLLALYSGMVISDPELLNNHESSIILDALSSLNDFNLDHFEIAVTFINERDDSQISAEDGFRTIMLRNGFSDTQIDAQIGSFISSIKKLISLQVLEQETKTWGSFEKFLIEESPFTRTLYTLFMEYKSLYETNEEPSE